MARQQRRMTRDHDVAMFDKENDAMLLKQVPPDLEKRDYLCSQHEFLPVTSELELAVVYCLHLHRSKAGVS